MTVQRSFTPTPESVALARRFVLDHIPQLSHQTREHITLIVSELATNAVLHAATPFTVALTLTEQTLTLEVTDRSRLEATAAEEFPAAGEPHGRGLLIVTRLAPEWGVTTNHIPSGKTVWVKLRLGDAEGSIHTEEGAETTQRAAGSALRRAPFDGVDRDGRSYPRLPLQQRTIPPTGFEPVLPP
jgi:anti-sigma regulatory factor (Ser/Thr protein kinase)